MILIVNSFSISHIHCLSHTCSVIYKQRWLAGQVNPVHHRKSLSYSWTWFWSGFPGTTLDLPQSKSRFRPALWFSLVPYCSSPRWSQAPSFVNPPRDVHKGCDMNLRMLKRESTRGLSQKLSKLWARTSAGVKWYMYTEVSGVVLIYTSCGPDPSLNLTERTSECVQLMCCTSLWKLGTLSHGKQPAQLLDTIF